MLDVMRHSIVYMEYFDDTLLMLRNFEKTIFVKKFDGTLFKFSTFKQFWSVGKLSSKNSMWTI